MSRLCDYFSVGCLVNFTLAKVFRAFWVYFSVSLSFGCVSTLSGDSSYSSHRLPIPEANTELFRIESIEVPSIDSISNLTAEQLAELKNFIKKNDISILSPRDQVFEFVSRKMQHFNYEGKTYTASEALRVQSGNCMSLALLTYAVAKQLNVKASFQVIHASPLLINIENDLVVSSDHVRVFLSDQEFKGHYLSGGQYTMVDYFPDTNDRAGALISEQEFLAMFYRNLAAEALLVNDFNYAYAMLQYGFVLSQQYAPIINMLAVLHRRLGDFETAEKFYNYGLSIAESRVVLLSNYRQLLLQKGDEQGVIQIDKQLLALNDSNPYDWYSLGAEALKTSDYEKAQAYFKKFIENTPYFHHAYYELAKAQFALGNINAAKKSINTAIELAALPENQQKYNAKLKWLTTHAN